MLDDDVIFYIKKIDLNSTYEEWYSIYCNILLDTPTCKSTPHSTGTCTRYLYNSTSYLSTLYLVLPVVYPSKATPVLPVVHKYLPVVQYSTSGRELLQEYYLYR
jgi:hypothetical protein